MSDEIRTEQELTRRQGCTRLDQTLGSIIENWLVRTTPNCRFCNDELDAEKEELEAREQFCGKKCKESFNKVLEARIAIGQRDLEQRGYD